jgi:hypothetical protein
MDLKTNKNVLGNYYFRVVKKRQKWGKKYT